MPAGMTYDMTSIEQLPEFCDVASIYRRTGGFNLVTDDLVAGSTVPPLAPLHIDFASRKAYVVKNVKVYEAALANATKIKIYKNSAAYVGMVLGNGTKSAAVTAIDKTNAAYDEVTITLGAAVTAKQVLMQVGAAANAVKGVYSLTIGTNATAGDKISVGGIEFEFASAPAEGKVVVGATAAASAANLDSVLEQELTLTALYDITYKGAVIKFTQKVAGVGDSPALVVTPVAETGTLAATIATTTEGSAGSTTPLLVANGLNYASRKVESGAVLDVIGGVMEIMEDNLVMPVSAADKTNLGHRYDFI